ncbi:MAG: quinol dehydrogenase ferredoxin subunit NapH [Myxococcota bacterium]|jgi:ferredoxin-type protein NapH|nr:quinol dehydrogenase ferredoxin subunit NapH [Myxococcota bacterium]
MRFLYRHRFLIARRVVSIGILVLLWMGANAHLGVLTGNLSSSRLFRTVPLSDPYAVLQILAAGQPLASTVLLGAVIVLLFYALVGGRAFCGWVCPVGIISDGSSWIKRRFQLRGQFRVARSARHWIMVVALPVSAITGLAAFEWLSPVGIVQREIIYGPTLGLAVVVAAFVVADVFVLHNGWCGSLCPLGAFYSLVGRVSLARIGFQVDRCDHCGDCVVVCPEPHVIDFHEMAQKGIVGSGDCLNCARCLEVCPRDAYRFASHFHRSAAPDLDEGDHHATKHAA